MVESMVPVSLDFDPADAHPAVTVGGETVKFQLRHRWIPEHDVPLVMGPVPMQQGSVPTQRMKRTFLLIDPVDGNRFRVTDRLACRVPPAVYFALSLMAVVGVLLFSPELLLAVTGVALGCAWIGRG